jgi:RimJ/RimL family protein N-acetyltransferase
MTTVRLRPLSADDVPLLTAARGEDNPFEFFGHQPSNRLARRFADDGCISADSAQLAVETTQGVLAGSVGWHAVRHGPGDSGRALNIGITLLAEHRGRGMGAAAQIELARYLFGATLVERLEAHTDVENIAEQRALEKAGFRREGIARHAQYRLGEWHDLVQYSRLRHDPTPGAG